MENPEILSSHLIDLRIALHSIQKIYSQIIDKDQLRINVNDGL